MKRIAPLASTLMLTLAGTSHGIAAAADTRDDTQDNLPTVNVTASGNSGQGNRARSASVAGFDDAPLLDTPASVAVVTKDQMANQQSRLLSDVIKNDAAIGENYAPVGYYENFSIRGIALDPASAYRIDGLTAAGEQNIALENKERVEFLKGVAGLQAGVSAAGGIVNYVTKRPADVRSVMFGTDSNGSRYVGADVGALFGDRKQFGLRVNAAHEDIHSYVDHGDGWRDFASVAASWAITSKTLLQFNAEYQQKAQRSVAGYQLLGGTALPANVSPRTMLTAQSWAQPVRNTSLNYNLRLDTEFNSDWRGTIQAGRSRTVIDDYLAFPYGNGFSPVFGANGDFDVYDYRSPDDDRRNDEAQAFINGKFTTGFIKHDLTLGLSLMRRVVDKSNGISSYVGSDNIYNTTPLAFPPSTDTIPGSYRNLDSRQKAIFFSDRVTFSDQWQVIAGGRQVWLNEQAFASDGSGHVDRTTNRNLFLPQFALIYKPVQNMSIYGSYAETLTLGTSAPFWVSNYPTTLPPSVARQLEAGIKYDVNADLSLTAAVFRIRKAYEYQQPDGAGGFTYVQQGKQTNTGIELGANGKLTPRLQLGASVAVTRARASDTGTPAYDNQQAVNVPRLRSAVYADYAVPGIDGLNAQGSWLYSSSKPVTRDGSVSLPAAHVFNAGLRYKAQFGGHAATIRLNVDNVFDKRYWKDAGEYLGDSYVHLGAPRTARLSLQYDF